MMKPRKSVRRVMTSVALAATLALLPATATVAQAQAPRGAGIVGAHHGNCQRLLMEPFRR